MELARKIRGITVLFYANVRANCIQDMGIDPSAITHACPFVDHSLYTRLHKRTQHRSDDTVSMVFHNKIVVISRCRGGAKAAAPTHVEGCSLLLAAAKARLINLRWLVLKNFDCPLSTYEK